MGRRWAGAQDNSACLLVPAYMPKWGGSLYPQVHKQAKTGSFKESGQTLHEGLTTIQDALLPTPILHPFQPAGHHLPLLPRAHTALTDLPKKPNWKAEGSRGRREDTGNKNPVPWQGHQTRMNEH